MVNMSFKQLIEQLDKENYIDVVRVLKVKYGITLKHLAMISGISYTSLKTAFKFGTTEGAVREHRVIEACERVKAVYLG